MDTNTSTIIEAKKGWRFVNFREVWQYRDLFYFLVLRDIVVKYKQTVFGILWAIIQPVGTMLVFTVFFGNLARIPNDNIPYPLFYYAALVPWSYFAGTMTASVQSLNTNVNLLTKVYFPRIILPIIPAIARLVDLSIALALFIILMLIYGVVPGLSIMMLPVEPSASEP